ncbi:MAG: DUF6057 family protein [Parabacteroides sp.]|nr:DUF6057 family protein [Parabacteroides sp.]
MWNYLVKYKAVFTVFLFFLMQGAALYAAFRYLFPFKEQMQLFRFAGDYAATTLPQAGGVALYLSGFLLQFYIYPAAGAFITSFLLTAVVALAWSILKKLNPAHALPFLAFLPWLSLLAVHFDYNYLEQGTVAYLFLLVFLRVYLSLEPAVRIGYGCLAIPVLYILAGPVAFLFAVGALLCEGLVYKNVRYLPLLYLPVAALTATAGCYFVWSVSLRTALLPDAYYDPMLRSGALYYSWFALPAVLITAGLLRKRIRPDKVPAQRTKRLSVAVQTVVLAWLVYVTVRTYGALGLQENMRQDYDVRTENWEEIIARYTPERLTNRKTCLLNLALVRTGQLDDRLLEFPQNGIEALLLPWDQTLFTAQLHSDVYYAMGLASASRKFAFEGLASSRPSGNPRLLKRLVETNLVTGAYAVAEKYIALLEQTWHYRDWAHAQRRYLYNDAAVEAHPQWGTMRRCWQVETTLPGMYVNPVSTLWEVLPECPGNRGGRQYLVAFLLLNKDLDRYRELHERLYNTSAWPELSVCQQEAVVICAPNDPKYWLGHGVGIPVRNRAIAFMQALPRNAGAEQARAALVAEYGQTYWYYYMFHSK